MPQHLELPANAGEPQAGPGEQRDQALVHQFIRLVGRPPTDEELRHYQAAHARTLLRRPGRLRRTAARIVTRW